MRRAVSGAYIVLPLLLLFANLISSRPASPPNQKDEGKRAAALTFVRLVNTAEAWYRGKHGRYLPFQELAKSPEMKEAGQAHFASIYAGLNLQSESEPLPGFKLSMVVSPGGDAYKLFLVDRNDACLFGFFTDESGLISHGTNIECPLGGQNK